MSICLAVCRICLPPIPGVQLATLIFIVVWLTRLRSRLAGFLFHSPKPQLVLYGRDKLWKCVILRRHMHACNLRIFVFCKHLIIMRCACDKQNDVMWQAWLQHVIWKWILKSGAPFNGHWRIGLMFMWHACDKQNDVMWQAWWFWHVT